jgi:hypothetical protein
VHWSDDCGFHSCEEEGCKVKGKNCGIIDPASTGFVILSKAKNPKNLHNVQDKQQQDNSKIAKLT